jgi:hypothetical protein
MPDSALQALKAALDQCEQHARILTQDPLPPESPFVQKLQRLERLGAIPSAQAWRVLREARNSLAHEHPQRPELQAAQWTIFVTAAGDLVSIWAAVKEFAASEAVLRDPV